MWRIAAALRALFTGLMFVYFGAGSLLFSWLVVPLVGRRAPRVAAIRKRQALVARGFDLFHWMMTKLRLITFEPRKVSVPSLDGPCVFVANHPTLVDVTAVLAVVRSACIVVRHGLYQGSMMGPLLRACGHIDAGDGATSVIDGAVDRLACGLSVLIFPEGTRSPVGARHPFERGAFEIALRAKVPIVPVFITCDPPMLMKGDPWYRLRKGPSLMRVEFGEPLSVDPAREDRRHLASRVEALYQRRLSTRSP